MHPSYLGILLASAMLTGCSTQTKVPEAIIAYKTVGKSLDYTQAKHWIRRDRAPKHPVDLFYIYPTVSMQSKDGAFSDLEAEVRASAQEAFSTQGRAFEPYTNVFAPYYRQATLQKALQYKTADSLVAFLANSKAKTDIYAALDRFFEHHNQGRPYILAGHSQGSALLKIVLEEYLKAHPKRLKRMVAAYVIGYPLTSEWLRKNPHLKFATGETDTGVIVSWNTEGPGSTLAHMFTAKNGLLINPINWKRDETPARIAENKGTLNTKTGRIETGSADATIDLSRRMLICTTHAKDYIEPPYTEFFGDKSLHCDDYRLYFANIRENGQKRIQAYLAKQTD